MKPDGISDGLEEKLESLPDLVAAAKERWLNKRDELKRREANKYLSMKTEFPDMRSTEIKANVSADSAIFDYRLEVNKAEAEYEALSLTHLADKKRASFRNQY